jgi:two-component system KDP operon response regulator KdpE
VLSRATGARILIVDDEPSFVRLVRANLGRRGFRVETAATGRDALAAYDRVHPDMVLLDPSLPDMDGREIIQSVRERSATPIIVLSARGTEGTKVAALNLGADDYLTKPCGLDELLARIRVALRRVARPASGADPVFRACGLAVDLERRRVTSGGRDVHLTPTEYELLKALLAHRNEVVTDRALLRQVWGADYVGEVHYLHVYVARLRRKIETDPQQPRYLVTETGVGYRFVVEDAGGAEAPRS